MTFQNPTRPFRIQEITSFALTVGTTATPILAGTTFVSTYIDSLIINLPSAAGNPIFFGGQGVTVDNGVEIPEGTSVNLALNNTRQLYEIEYPLRRILGFLKCTGFRPPEIPVKVFDPSQIYAVASAGTNARIMIFPSSYV